MRLVAEIIGWIVIGGCGFSLAFLIGMIIWDAIDNDLFCYRMRREEKK